MKRVLDVLAAALGIIVLSPLFIGVAVAVWTSLGRPIFFRQVRAGLNGELFTLIKFRTMCDDAELCGKLRPDAERLTRVGWFLRSTSLDELPELWNVLKGEMSLVGPRPLLREYLPLYSEDQARRHEVRPGITGWAQVNGRNELSWEEKFDMDVWYVENRTFLLDLKVLGMTLWKVLTREGISRKNEVTAPPFIGSLDE